MLGNLGEANETLFPPGQDCSINKVAGCLSFDFGVIFPLLHFLLSCAFQTLKWPLDGECQHLKNKGDFLV